MPSTLVKRPGLFLAAGLLVTLAGARLINFAFPRHHLVPGVRIHHYVYGIFALTAAGYLALVFKGPRATFWIGLLYALGLGLTFDEFNYWFNPQPFLRRVPWSPNGVLVLAGAFLGIAAVRSAVRWRRASSSRLEPRDESPPARGA